MSKPTNGYHDTDHGPCECGAWHQPEIPWPPSKDEVRLAERSRLLELAKEKICDLQQRISDLEEENNALRVRLVDDDDITKWP